jgi:hypothetical protein
VSRSTTVVQARAEHKRSDEFAAPPRIAQIVRSPAGSVGSNLVRDAERTAQNDAEHGDADALTVRI